MARTIKTFDDFGDTIADAVLRLVGNSVKRTMTKVETAAIKLQRNMFTYLASRAGVINAGAAPTFNISDSSLPQPQYADLTPDYHKRKLKKLGTLIGGNSYYMYSGYFKRYMSSIGNPLTTFGTPTLSFERPGQRGTTALYQGNSKLGFTGQFFDNKGTPTDKFNALKTRLGTITVDLYPKVPGKLTKGMTWKPYFSGAKTIAYRLDNPHGLQKREFMPQYMEWWLYVKGKEAIRGALK